MQTYQAWRATKQVVNAVVGLAVVALVGVTVYAVGRLLQLRAGSKARESFEGSDGTGS